MPLHENKNILVVGDANVDLLVNFPHRLPGGKTIAPKPELMGGGSAANTAMALRHLGLPVTFMGTVGSDAYGRYMLDEFQQAGINAAPTIVDPALNTVCVFAFVDEDGERYPWPWPLENQSFRELAPEKIDWHTVETAGWVHSSGMLFSADTSARHSVIAIFKKAHELGIPTSFDLNMRVEGDTLNDSYRQALLDVMEYSSVVLGSGQEEFFYLAPQQPWQQTAASFVRPGRAIIARMGAEGSMVLSTGGESFVPAYPTKVTDTVGAGDSYNAGFIAANIQGLSLEDSLRWGNACGSYTVARKGSRATPTQVEIEKIIQNSRL